MTSPSWMEGLRLSPISPEREKQLLLFLEGAGIRFRDLRFLNLSFCHRSLASETGSVLANNERLEFLGDSVLGLVISEYLFTVLAHRNEGELAKIKSYVVSEETLSEIGRGLGIDSVILLGKGEENSGGRSKRAIIADALEALIGALYLDQGLEAVRSFIRAQCLDYIDQVVNNRHRKDYKTLLQEFAQKKLKLQPRYSCIDKSGPDHAKIFTMEVLIGDLRFGPSKGNNKKEAEQGAAKLAWVHFFPETD